MSETQNEPTPIDEDDIEQYYKSFSARCGGIARTCVCGRTYYHPHARGDFEEGELEGYEADPKAQAIDFTPGGVFLFGIEYCDACDCWHERAQQVVNFLRSDQQFIGRFYALEKKRLIDAANAVPTVQHLD